MGSVCFRGQHFVIYPFPNKPKQVSTCLQYKSFKNTVDKGEIARNEQFLLLPQCFLPVLRTFCHFCQIWNGRLQTLSVWKNLKFVVWERVKGFISTVFEREIRLFNSTDVSDLLKSLTLSSY